MNLPPSNKALPVEKLIQVFQDKTASYKFLLFKSVLDEVHNNNHAKNSNGFIEIPYLTLCASMLSVAAYPIQMFKFSLGYSDKINDRIKDVESLTDWQLNSLVNSEADIKKTLITTFQNFNLKKIEDELLVKNVLWRLLSPWFSLSQAKSDSEKKTIVERGSQDFSIKTLYSIFPKERKVLVSPVWFAYLQENYSILLGWWEINFVRYLEKNNPGVSNIAGKLELSNESNLKDARDYWKEFVNAKHPMCVFSKKTIVQPYAIDHFLPWSYVGHDEMWNLSPLTKSLNSSKSNQLPALEYLEPFAKLQWNFLQFHLGKKNYKLSDKKLECYPRDLKINIEILPQNNFSEPNEIFINAYSNLYKLEYSRAERMGFDVDWVIQVNRFAGINICLAPKRDRYKNYVPYFELKATGGGFDLEQYLGNLNESESWVKVEDIALREGMFVMQVVGSSMAPLINDGDYCLFRPVGGTRNGLNVLVQLSDYLEPNQNARYTVKAYSSEKSFDEFGNFQHTKITLKAKNPEYDDIIIEDATEDKFKVLGEFVAVIKI